MSRRINGEAFESPKSGDVPSDGDVAIRRLLMELPLVAFMAGFAVGLVLGAVFGR